VPVPERKPNCPPPNIDKETALTVLKFLRKKNLGVTESALRQELGLLDPLPDGELDDGDDADDLSSSVWSAYKTESDPLDYEATYTEFKKFLGAFWAVESCSFVKDSVSLTVFAGPQIGSFLARWGGCS
jgi:hypothetical protein